MEEIKLRIKESEWNDVISYLKMYEKKDVKPELYYKLSKLHNIYNQAMILSKRTWYENCTVPQIEDAHCKKLRLNEDAIENLNEKIANLNELIYNSIMNLEVDIKQLIIKQYTLTQLYKKFQNGNLCQELGVDWGSIRGELKQKLSKNMFEDKSVAKNAMYTYHYLLRLQLILKKLKEIQTNEKIEKMLKLISHTKAQLKQIIDNLDCRLLTTDYNEIEIAKRLTDGTDKTLYYMQQSTINNLDK